MKIPLIVIAVLVLLLLRLNLPGKPASYNVAFREPQGMKESLAKWMTGFSIDHSQWVVTDCLLFKVAKNENGLELVAFPFSGWRFSQGDCR